MNNISWKSISKYGFILVILSMLLLIAACSKDAKPGGSTAPGDKTQTGSTEKPKDKPKEEKPAEVKRGKISVMIYDRGNIPADQGTLEDNRWTQWIIENGPVDIEYIPIDRGKPNEKLSVLFASKKGPDVITEYSTLRDAWYQAKQLMPLDDLIDTHSTVYKKIIEDFPILRKLGTKDDGQLYDLGRMNVMQHNWVYLIREDWLKDAGLNSPETIDDLYDVAVAFSKRSSDTYGVGLAGKPSARANRIFDIMHGVSIDGKYVPGDGTLVREWDQLQASTEFKKKLYDAGIVDRDFLSDPGGDNVKRDFINGKLGLYASTSSELTEVLTSTLKNDPNAIIKPIALPKTKFGQFSPPISAPVSVPVVINTTTSDPVAVIKFIDFMNEDATTKVLHWGIEGEHYKLNADGCPVPIDLEHNKKTLDWNGDYKLFSQTQTISQCALPQNIVDTSNPISVAVQEIKEESDKLYVNPARPLPGFTSEAYVPSIPTELKLIQDSVNINDELMKTIVDKGYAVADAMVKIKKDYVAAGGEQIDQWFKDWWEKNKDTALLLKDIYELAK